MAPEQIRGTPEISHKTDLYALGRGPLPDAHRRAAVRRQSSAVVLMHAHINSPPPSASAKVEEIPKALDDLIVNLMAKTPERPPLGREAVGQTLRPPGQGLARRPIAMVWPEAGTAGSMPTRAEVDRPDREAIEANAKPKEGSRKKGAAERPHPSRLEVAGLVAGLVLVGGLIAYVVWPAGPEASSTGTPRP